MKTLLTTIIFLALAGSASAARPLITQHDADAEAKDSLEFTISYGVTYGGQDDPTDEVFAYGVSYELDPCEVGRRNAYCDYTMTFSDGDVCDGTIKIWRTRRGRIASADELDYCDGEG